MQGPMHELYSLSSIRDLSFFAHARIIRATAFYFGLFGGDFGVGVFGHPRDHQNFGGNHYDESHIDLYTSSYQDRAMLELYPTR